MENWDRNLGLVLLLLGVGVVAYGLTFHYYIIAPWMYEDTFRTYVGITSGAGVLLAVLGILEIAHGLPKKPSKIPSPMETDEQGV